MMGNIDILSIIKPLGLHLGSCHQEGKKAYSKTAHSHSITNLFST